MRTVVELRQERASEVSAQTVLVDAARAAGNRALTEVETTDFDAIQARIEGLDASITRAVQFEANQAREVAAQVALGDGSPEIDAPATPFSLLRSLRALASGNPLHADDAAVHEQAQAEMRANGMTLPEGNAISMSATLTRAQTVSGDSGAKGGVLVASTPTLVRPLQPVLAIESLGVNVMSGLVGDVPLPTSGALTFSYSGETNATSATDIGFAGPTLKPKRCSGVVDISKKLLAQTNFSVENYILEQIRIAYGNAITTAAINGPGGDAPTGLYSLITTNINTTASALTHAIAVDLEGKVDASDGTSVNLAYLSDTKVKSSTKTTLLDAGSGRFLSDGKELNGHPFLSTTLMPTLDSGASHPIIYGDWNQLTVGYFGTVSIIVDPYTQAASGKVRLIIEGFSDVAVTNEKAFAINKVITV